MTKESFKNLKKNEYAGFWVRFAAFAIDFFVLILISIVAAIIFAIFTKITKINYDMEVVSSFVGFFINAGYYVFMTYRYGATIGKKVLGIKVEGKDGQVLDIGTVIVREVAGKFISTMLMGIGYLWIIFNKRKQSFHDKFAGTVVVIENRKKNSKWKVGIISVAFALFLIIFSIWILLGVLDEDFEDIINRDQIVLLVGRTLVPGKLCISEGNDLTNPQSTLGGGDICSEEIGANWPKLGAGYEYGEVNNDAIILNKDGIAVFICRPESSECELIEE